MGSSSSSHLSATSHASSFQESREHLYHALSTGAQGGAVSFTIGGGGSSGGYQASIHEFFWRHS